jgi:hypothetical protein
VKIQIPVKEDPIKTPYVTVEGSVVTETPELDARVAEALGWSVKRISESETAIFKGNIYIQVDEAGKTESENVSRYDTFIQVRVGDAETLRDDVRAEIEEALIAIGLDGFEAILKDENVVVGFEEYTDLVPSVGVDPENFDWREAMKTELKWLRESDLVSGLTDRDIQDISSICGRGTAGHNSRIVYEEGWIPYNKTNNPLLLRDWDCGGFSAESLPEEDLGDLNDGSEAIPWTYPAAAIAIIAAVLSLLLYARRRA